jgi:hypothetical protein
MGCSASVDAPAAVSIQAAQRITDAITEADTHFAEGRVEEAERIVYAARDSNLHLLIGGDAPAYSAKSNTKLADYRFAAEDYMTALRLYRDAANVSLGQAKQVREGSYLMVQRYKDASVGYARCRLALLGNAQRRLEEAVKRAVAYMQRMQPPVPVVASDESPPVSPSHFRRVEGIQSPDEDSASPVLDSSLRHNTTTSITSDGGARPPMLLMVDSDGGMSDEPRDAETPPSELLTPRARARHCERDVQRRIGSMEHMLLNCVENIDRWHSHRSEMLIDPLMLLAELYERLQMWEQCERTVRRLSGVFMVKYGHSHPAYQRTHQWLIRLSDRSEAKAAKKAATSIVATWKMRKAVCALAHRIGRDMTRSRTPTPLTSPRNRSPTHVGQQSYPDFMSVFATANVVEDSADGDALLRRALEAVPKGRQSAGVWISSDMDTPPRSAEVPPLPGTAAANKLTVVRLPATAPAPPAQIDGNPMQATSSIPRRKSNVKRVITSLVFDNASRRDNRPGDTPTTTTSLWQVAS